MSAAGSRSFEKASKPASSAPSSTFRSPRTASWECLTGSTNGTTRRAASACRRWPSNSPPWHSPASPLLRPRRDAAGLRRPADRPLRQNSVQYLSQDRLDALAADDVEEHERRTAWAFCAPLQLRDVTDCEVEIAGKNRLA